MRLSDIIKNLKGIFEKKKKNPIQLENDSNLEPNLKFLKVSDKSTPIQISDDTINIQGSLTVNGDSVQTGTDAGATALDELSDVTYSSGDLTISSLDKIIVSNDLLIQTADGAQDLFKVIVDGGSNNFFELGAEANNYSSLRLNEAGGDSTTDYFQISTSEHGATIISTVDGAGENADLTFSIDGDIIHKKISDDANGPEFVFQKQRSDTTIDDNDYVGRIQWKAYDDQGTPEIMTAGALYVRVLDASSTDEKAEMVFKVLTDEFSDSDNPTSFLSATGIGTGYSNVQVNLGAGTSTNNFIHGLTKFTASTHGSEATNGKIHVMPYVAGTAPYILIESAADNGDYCKIQVLASGQTTISTVDDSGAAGADLALDVDGDITLDAATGNITAKDNGGNYTPSSDYHVATKKYVDDNAGAAKETFVINARFTPKNDTNKWVGGRMNDYYKSSEIWGLSTAKTGSNYTDTAASAWATFNYVDVVVANACTVTKFTCSAYQNTADCDFIVGLWKMTPAANTNHIGNATVDFIGEIEFTANADTSTLHAVQSITSFESGASLSAGDCIIVAGTVGAGGIGSDRTYWWINGAIEVEYS